MLSYRHAFHAGNHADILKHHLLSLVLDYFNQKDKPYCVIDTHAGAGMYALESDFSQKNMEFETGVSRLLDAQSLPDSLTQFCAMLRAFNVNKTLEYYPGSPKISAHHLRASDQLRLFELHPRDYETLCHQFDQAKMRRVQIKQQDGFKGLKACLPPTTKRGIVVIDPPYEQKEDYQRVVDSIHDSLKRFATGTYLIWYPLLNRPEPDLMIQALGALNVDNWLNATLSVTPPQQNDIGMYGSGVYMINPPWLLPNILKESLPVLANVLGQTGAGAHALTFQIT